MGEQTAAGARMVERGPWRTRWAAIGAAVAVTVGAGGLYTVGADSAPSAFVAVDPVRVLDTRLDGFGGAFTSAQPRLLTVTGTIPTVAADGITVTNRQAVADGATAIVANVTAVTPSTPGFVAVRPGTATGNPTTSSINFTTSGVVAPNSVTVEVPTSGPTAGQIELFFSGASPAATTHLLVDIVGYYTAVDAAPAPARVVWVAASGGDFTSVTAALASITDASATTPYVVRVAPGIYDEPGGVTMQSFVDVEGSGPTTTTIRCACSAATDTGAGVATVRFGAGVTAEVRGLTVVNTGGGANATGVLFDGAGAGARLRDAAVTAQGGTTNTYAVHSHGSAARVDRTSITVTSTGGFVEGVVVDGASVPVLDQLDVTASSSGSPRALLLVGSGQVVVTDSVVRSIATVPGSGAPITVHVGGSARIERTRITATGGAVARGVLVFGGNAEIDDSVVIASGATTNTGVDHTFTSARSFISDSTVTGSTNSVRRPDALQEVRIATTRLSGPTTGAPTCFDTYSATFAAFTCT